MERLNHSLTHNGETVTINTSPNDHIGWCSDWSVLLGWVNIERVPFLRSVFGGPGTYGHIDLFFVESDLPEETSYEYDDRPHYERNQFPMCCEEVEHNA